MFDRDDYLTSAHPPPLKASSWSVDSPFLQEISLALIAFSLIVMLVCLIQRQQRKRKANLAKAGGRTMLSHQLMTSGSRCAQCHYLTQNPYLPCAVNPHQVATLEAVNCADFRQKKCDFSSQFYLDAVNRKHQLSVPKQTSYRPKVNRPTVEERYQAMWSDGVNDH